MTWYDVFVQPLVDLDKHISLAFIAGALVVVGFLLFDNARRVTFSEKFSERMFGAGLILCAIGSYVAFIGMYVMTR